MNKIIKIDPIIVSLFFIIFYKYSYCSSNKDEEKQKEIPFDSQNWVEGDGRLRGAMSDGLIASEILMGKHISEIRHLLGKPDQEWSGHISYWIDIGHEFISSPWMYYRCIRYDSTTGITKTVWISD